MVLDSSQLVGRNQSVVGHQLHIDEGCNNLEVVLHAVMSLAHGAPQPLVQRLDFISFFLQLDLGFFLQLDLGPPDFRELTHGGADGCDLAPMPGAVTAVCHMAKGRYPSAKARFPVVYYL